jgi:BNR/Asp-box repeat protein
LRPAPIEPPLLRAGLLACGLLFAASAGLARGADGAQEHGMHRRTTGVTGVLSLDVFAADGALHLLTGRLESSGERTLSYQVSRDGGASWSASAAVATAANAPQIFRRGNDAQIAASGGNLVAAWTGKGTGWSGSGPLATAVSRDGGKSWRPGGNPADNAATTTHAFIELAADAGGFRLVWIDNRDATAGVRTAFSGDGGRWSANATVDAQTCECCWNSMAAAGKELFVLYRDASPRDMALAVSSGGAWRRMGSVGSFNWDINACPEAGGALAVSRSRAQLPLLHALVWTGRDDVLGLYHVLSTDGGKSWSRPRRMGGPDARNSDLVAAPGGAMAAVWDDSADQLVRAAVSGDDGKTWSSPRVLSASGVRATHPRVVATTSGFRVFWTELTRDGSVMEWKSVALPGS